MAGKWLQALPASLVTALVLAPSVALAQEDPPIATQIADVAKHLDWIWTCIAAFLVFFMQAGFALVERCREFETWDTCRRSPTLRVDSLVPPE